VLKDAKLQKNKTFFSEKIQKSKTFLWFVVAAVAKRYDQKKLGPVS
jgi:hypothetical protein